MASTSTNKQPLLIDRVFNEVTQTDGLVSGSSNTATGASISYDIGGSNAAVVLVNCTTNDGGLVEDIYAISRGSSKKALFYLSAASDYLRSTEALFIGSIDVTATVGEYANITALPRTMAPVPQQGVVSGMTALTQGNPLKNQALYVPTGKALWVTIYGAGTDNLGSCPYVGAQGGFF